MRLFLQIIAGSTNPNDFHSPMHHAMEIVNCSLVIRDYIRNYPIPHFPDERIKIRIGVHTGSVVTGVAGVGASFIFQYVNVLANSFHCFSDASILCGRRNTGYSRGHRS